MTGSYLQRDKDISKEIHKLYWSAMLNTKLYLLLSLLIAPAFFLLYVYIPLQVAYALQAIFIRDFDGVNEYIIKIVIAGSAQILIHGISNYGMNRLGIEACSYIQKKIFKNYLDKDYEFYSNQYAGSLGTMAAQIRESCSAYIDLIITKFAKNVTIIIGGLTVIFINSVQLAFITLVCMFLILGFTMATSKLRLRYRREVSRTSSKLSGILGDALGNGATVKSFANEKYEQSFLDNALGEWRTSQLKSWDSYIPTNTGRNILNFITLAVLIVVASKLYQNGTIGIAIVVLIQLYMIRLIATVIEISELVKNYETMMSTSHEAVRTMLIPKTITDPVNPVLLESKVNKLEFISTSFKYPDSNSKYAIKNFDLTIKRGERIGLVGYSGSGKTTLTKLILRFIDLTSGNIKIDGTDIRDISQNNLRNLISYVPQEPLLFHRSIRDNIAYGKPDASSNDILRAAKLAYVDEFVKDMPKGYDTLVGEKGVKLSGGQRQRVAIARAILRDSPVLVLDEATSALDSRSESYIQNALMNLMKNKTSIVIAHRLSTIQEMDKIVVMDKGKIVEQGSHAQLKSSQGIYSELWKHQSGGYLDLEEDNQ